MKIAFVGFGEVNTPVEIIERKCGKALEDLKKSGAEIYSIYPVTDDYDGPERAEFPETPALCIYYRGPYEGTATAIRALMQYVKENNIEVTGPFRSIYMEGPPNRGENKEDYITQIAVPIKG